MLLGAKGAFFKAGLRKKQIDVFHVPGAFEIPITAQKLLDTKKYKGILSLGCVIKGKTNHYEYVCRGVTCGIQKLSIKKRFPIIFGVLMCKNASQAKARIKKSEDFAKSLLKMIELFKKLSIIKSR